MENGIGFIFKINPTCFSVVSMLCTFNTFTEGGTHLDKSWFRWSGGRVPFYFNATVTNDDRIMFRSMMKEIQKKSCVRFIEKTQPPSGQI